MNPHYHDEPLLCLIHYFQHIVTEINLHHLAIVHLLSFFHNQYPYMDLHILSLTMEILELHEKAKAVLRIDIQQVPGLDYKRVIGQLAALSNDPVFLGYPYPLIKTDMLARVTNEQVQHLKTICSVEAKQSWEKMHIQEQHTKIHDILDNMRF